MTPATPYLELPGLTDPEYDALPGLRSSHVKELLRSPAHYRYAADHPREDTAAFVLGRALHCRVLRPDVYPRDFIATDLPDRRSKEYKAVLASAGPTQSVLLADNVQAVEGMAHAILAHQQAGVLLKPGTFEAELSAQYVEPSTEVLVKCRWDAIWGGNVIVDIKTTPDARPDSFKYKFRDFGYDIQAALYSYVLGYGRGGMPTFVVVAVEKEPPYGVVVYRVPASRIELAWAKVQAALGVFCACTASGEWPCYPETIDETALLWTVHTSTPA